MSTTPYRGWSFKIPYNRSYFPNPRHPALYILATSFSVLALNHISFQGLRNYTSCIFGALPKFISSCIYVCIYIYQCIVYRVRHLVRGLCYVMLCYVMLCYAMLCCVMLCYVLFCCVMICYAMLCYVMLCYVMVRCVML